MINWKYYFYLFLVTKLFLFIKIHVRIISVYKHKRVSTNFYANYRMFLLLVMEQARILLIEKCVHPINWRDVDSGHIYVRTPCTLYTSYKMYLLLIIEQTSILLMEEMWTLKMYTYVHHALCTPYYFCTYWSLFS